MKRNLFAGIRFLVHYACYFSLGRPHTVALADTPFSIVARYSGRWADIQGYMD
jgi:hypothetical protein